MLLDMKVNTSRLNDRFMIFIRDELGKRGTSNFN